MTKYLHRTIILLFFIIICMLLASCIPQPTYIIVPENQKVVVKTLHPPSEEILTCLDFSLSLPAEQLEEAFSKQKESFVAESTDANRSKLICLSLARLDKPDSLEYAQELMNDMQHIDKARYPDIKGLAALLSYFQYLQEKRIEEVGRAQQQVNELKQKLEELKSIDEIIKNRKDDN
ncbi:MAG: hypothetical protein KKA54_03640 [Proteobacteria bacterium]|nr:hypothetical protein [Pseudomonadota bacterium]MBU0965457.1 hypothetical protein [Pseudomonadota bacterium]